MSNFSHKYPQIPMCIINQGALEGKMKRHGFQIPREVQRSLDLLRTDTRKRETSENETIVLGLAPQCNKKKMVLGWIAVAFCAYHA